MKEAELKLLWCENCKSKVYISIPKDYVIARDKEHILIARDVDNEMKWCYLKCSQCVLNSSLR
jgi:hypothetical protein